MNKRDNAGRDVYDVAIVGAGPAGASAGVRLAAAGARVALLESKRFPRHKLCGEFISPECLVQFRQLGVADEMDAAHPAQITETVFFTVRGRRVHVPSLWFAGEGGTAALGLSRAEMDNRLLVRARAAGVEVYEGARATNLIRSETGGVHGVQFNRVGDAAQGELRARVTLDATGRAGFLSRLAEHGGAHAKRTRAALVAFKTHLAGVRGLRRESDEDGAPHHPAHVNRCEIYFYDGGYGGLNEVERGIGNLCFIVRAEAVRRCASDAERVMHEVVFRNERARTALCDARAVTPWLSVALEGFGRRPLAIAHGLLAIGDAASFIDPFTGSGMLMALESGETAAQTILLWLAAQHANTPAAHEQLQLQYKRAYAARFDSRLRFCSLLRQVAFAPAPLIELSAAALNLNARLRRRVVRATRGGAL